MMNLYKNIHVFLAAVVLSISCVKAEMLRPVSVSFSAESVCLSVEGSRRGEDALTLSWTGGADNAVYSVLMDLAGNDFKNAFIRDVGTCPGRSVALGSREVNMQIAGQWPQELSENTLFEFKLRAVLGDASFESEPVAVAIRSYGSLVEDLWVAGSSVPGGQHPGESCRMLKCEGGKFVWTGMLKTGELKFLPDADVEDVCFGRGDNDSTLVYHLPSAGGDPVFEITRRGFYCIILDTAELTVSMNLPNVVFLGDSITNNWYNNTSFLKDYGFVNMGVSGQTTGQMLQRMGPQVLAAVPDLVVFLGGVNDIAENDGPVSDNFVIRSIGKIASMARENGAGVVLCSILPINEIYWNPSVDVGDARDRILRINGMIEQLCFDEDYVYCDYFNAMKDGRGGIVQSLTKDGLHPNTAGYSVMQPLVLSAITEAFRSFRK